MISGPIYLQVFWKRPPENRQLQRYHTFFAKVLELLILDKLEMVFLEAEIPHINQSAYQKRVSCSDAIFATQEVYRKERPTHGGGVLVAIKQSLTSSIIPSPSDLEIVSVKIGVGTNDFALYIYVSMFHPSRLYLMLPP